MNAMPKIDRRMFLKYLCVSTVATGILSFNPTISRLLQFFANAQTHKPHEDAPNTHNMLVFGEKTIFLSHLPMFDKLNADKNDYLSPHRYQVILEASFQKNAASLLTVYADDRRKNPSVKIYTLNPEPFVLSKIFAESLPIPLQSFKAKVFRGHLEQGGREINGLTDVEVKIKRVIHFRKFNPQVSKPAELKYLLFGNSQEIFLAHYITAPPDFDQILSVKVEGQKLTDEVLRQGIEIIISGRKNSVGERLKENQTVAVQTAATVPRKLKIKVAGEIYFEEGELLVPPTFDQTDAEKS